MFHTSQIDMDFVCMNSFKAVIYFGISVDKLYS